MKRVYVAGAYSANNVMDVLHNIRKGIRASTEVFLAGFAVFSPWLDYHFILSLYDNEELTIGDFYQYSLAWLEVSDCMLVLQDYENSKGTLKEIERAKQLDIPVYYDLFELVEKEG